ncbi:MAG: hypothetical protein ACR2G9_08865 [Gaiellaceae bacterium]
MPEASASGNVTLREFVPAVDKAVEAYDLFIGEGTVTYVLLGEPSANLSVAQARKLVSGVDVTVRRALVEAFVERISRVPDIAEVWRVREADPLTVAVIVRDLSLDRDLELRAVFADLTFDHDAELHVYGETDDRAELGRRGERLLG